MSIKKNTKFLITGTAGFIGFHLARTLLEKKFSVLGIDGLTNYYDVRLKKNRHDILKKYSNFQACEIMIQEKRNLDQICLKFKPNVINASTNYALQKFPGSCCDAFETR